MKKWGALMLALCALCAAGRAETTIGELAAANALDALLARHAAYSINTIYYDEAGKETFSTYQAIGKRDGATVAAYEDSNGYTEYLVDGIVYFFDPATVKFAILAFFEGQYDAYVASFDDYVFVTDPAAELTILAGGDVLVTIPRTQDNAELMDSFCLNGVTGLSIRYAIDPESLEVRGYRVLALSEKGEQLVASAFLTYLDAPPAPPDYVKQLQNPTDPRTVTVVSPGGEERYTLPADAQFTMSLPDGYGLYYDPDGEMPVTPDSSAGGDLTLYIRAEER